MINTGLIFQYVDVTGWKFNVYILLVGVRWDLRQMFLWFSECTKLEGLLNPIYLLMTNIMMTLKVVAFLLLFKHDGTLVCDFGVIF